MLDADNHFTSYVVNLLAAVTFALLLWLFGSLRAFASRYLASRDPRALQIATIGLCLVGGAWFIFYPLMTDSNPWLAALPMVAVLTVLLLRHKHIWRSGIIGADSRIIQGVDYACSLRMCQTSLDFLGVGAHKLTTLPEFEEAIKRCHRPRPGRPIRFLLLSPEHPTLIDSAKVRGTLPHEFRDRVIASMRILQKLQQRFNIEVRFYPPAQARELPIWRLMFINDRICLASYNVWGHEGEGRSQPQLHLVRRHVDENQSFYYPFHFYFQNIWEAATPWDFTKYL